MGPRERERERERERYRQKERARENEKAREIERPGLYTCLFGQMTMLLQPNCYDFVDPLQIFDSKRIGLQVLMYFLFPLLSV